MSQASTDPELLEEEVQESHTSAKSAAIQTYIAQAVVLAIGVFAVVNALSLKLWTSFGPGPGFFPFILGAILVALSGMWVLEVRKTGPEISETVSRQRVLSVMISLFILASVIEIFGFQLTMLIFLIFHLRIIGKQKWWLTLVLAAFGSFGAFLLFSTGLGVRLPAASIPFLNGLGF